MEAPPDTAFFIGAGFSAAAGLPPTNKIGNKFLDTPVTDDTPRFVQQQITEHLRTFRKQTFLNRTKRDQPTFEDHFTTLDLAANAGHALGPDLLPANLRAIRRLSLHRVFELVSSFAEKKWLRSLVSEVSVHSSNAIICTNWDIVLEKYLWSIGVDVNYGIPVGSLDKNSSKSNASSFKIIKLHGSLNRFYCDSCRQLFHGGQQTDTTAVKHWTFIKPDDFSRLGSQDSVVSRIHEEKTGRGLDCPDCGCELSTRVAAFSYSKSYGYPQFEAGLSAAMRILKKKCHWVFIGYSLPVADFEIRHLLKIAQMCGHTHPKITCVVRDKDGAKPYQRFFGIRPSEVYTRGLWQWRQDGYPTC